MKTKAKLLQEILKTTKKCASKKSEEGINVDALHKWWVYILGCADGSLYTGITNDVPRRVQQHEAGTGAKYTRRRGPFTILYLEPLTDRSSASKREIAIKRLNREAKDKMIIDNNTQTQIHFSDIS
jgi:putative endonuclease